MSDRTVTYTFRGNFTSLTAGLAASGRAVVDLGTKMTAADRKGAQYRRGLSSLGSTAGKMGLVAAAGIAVMVKATADFDQAMSNVNATGAVTTTQLGELRKAALAAGQTTKFSATEAAGGVEELLKAGVSASDVLGGALSGSLSLAAAGQIDVADAATIAATAMTEFKLSGTDVPHIADLIAAGAGKAQGDVSDMAEALKAGGLTASQFGVSLDDTVGTLTAFAAAGLLGSTSGTVMKQMLLKLAAPSQKAADTMDQYGISVYDTAGKFVGFTALAGELQAQLSGLTGEQRNAALATIFGSRAIQGANVLYADGAKGLEDYNKKVEDQGYAAKVAAARLDNLSGDLHKFKSALDVAFIGQGQGTQGPLRNLVQGATEATNAFNKLPTSVHTSVNALLTLTAVVGGGLWFSTKAIGAVGGMNSALKNLGVSAEASSRGLKAVGVTLVSLEVAGQGIQALINSTRESLPGVEQTTKELLALTTEIQTMSNTVGAAKLDSKFNDLGSSIQRISDKSFEQSFNDTASSISNVATSIIGLHTQAHSLSEAEAEVSALDAALANIATSGSAQQAQAAFDALAKSQGLSKDQQAELLKLMPQYNEALASSSNSAQLAAGATDGLAVSAQGNASAQDDQTKAINLANQAMKKQVDAAVSAFDAVTQYRQAVKDAAAQAKKSQDGIKGSSDAAIANRNALSGLSSAWNNQSAAVKNNVDKFKEAKQNFITTAEAMRVPEGAAKALAKQLLDIPRSMVTKVTADTASAMAALNGIQNYKLRDKYITVHTVQGSAPGPDQTAHGAGHHAAGGLAGTGRRASRPFPRSARRFAAGGYAGNPDAGLDKPLFTSEGPRFYKAAYAHNSPFAVPNPFDKSWPYQTPLTRDQELTFEKWVRANSIPFQPGSHLTDYDMRGFWKKAHPKSWKAGQHFPDTFKTPYDTTFSHESKYATADNPFYWKGNKLIDIRTGQVVFAPAARAGGGSVFGPGGPKDDLIPAWLSNREFVQPVAAVDYYGVDFMEAVRTLRFADGGQPSSGSTPSKKKPPAHGRPVTITLGEIQFFDVNLWDAAMGLKSLKAQSAAFGDALDKAKKAAGAAKDALAALKSQKADLSGSVSSAITHDPFQGSLADFNAQENADAADANAELAALKTLVANGLDPHSALFQRLAASGNIALIQQFAALSRSALASEATMFTNTQTALTAPGSFVGSQAFDSAIAAQTKVFNHLDQTVHQLAHEVNALGHRVEKGAHNGSKSGSQAGSRQGAAEGTARGMDSRDRRLRAFVRAGG